MNISVLVFGFGCTRSFIKTLYYKELLTIIKIFHCRINEIKIKKRGLKFMFYLNEIIKVCYYKIVGLLVDTI